MLCCVCGRSFAGGGGGGGTSGGGSHSAHHRTMMMDAASSPSPSPSSSSSATAMAASMLHTQTPESVSQRRSGGAAPGDGGSARKAMAGLRRLSPPRAVGPRWKVGGAGGLTMTNASDGLISPTAELAYGAALDRATGGGGVGGEF